MNRELLPHFPVVLAVARLKGFAAAAKALNMSPSAVGHAVRIVEDHIGEPLFARTTRSVSLTDAGHGFISTIGPAFEDIENALENLSANRGNVTGSLRISAPRVAVMMGLAPILLEFALSYPSVTVEIHTNDAFVDIVAEGYDAGIRLSEAIQQDMVAVRLTPRFKAILVASPEYLARCGTPSCLPQLVHHNCIGFRMPSAGNLYEWHVKDGENEARMAVSGTVILTDSTGARELALAGIGIGYIFEPLVRADINEGRLQILLPECSSEEEGLFLYFPRRNLMAPKLRVFVETIKELADRQSG